LWRAEQREKEEKKKKEEAGENEDDFRELTKEELCKLSMAE